MDNTLLVTLSAQNALTRRLEVAANNMANMSTAGYKSQEVLFEPVIRRPASMKDGDKTIEFVRDFSVMHDFRPGVLTTSDNPFDLALTNDGYFTVNTPNGPAYTRDGRFSIDANGRLITQDSKSVLDPSGNEIILDLEKGAPSIAKDGNIMQNGINVGKLAVVTFERQGTLDKIGDNLWRATSEAPNANGTYEVVQGMVEGSNVIAITELTKIMEISRAFEAATRLQRQAEDLRGKAIERLARV